jgi:PHD/YefM family antitoxin component YafN of YafNO toxin-antitoxin module
MLGKVQQIMPNNMITVHPQYVVDDSQTRTAVLIPADEWKQILEALEELDDIQAYDAAKAVPHGSCVSQVQRRVT